MNTNDPIEHIVNEAKSYSPFGEASDFGFETRLRAGLASLEPGVMDWLASLSWRFSLTCLPVLVAAAIFLTMQQQSDFFSSGVGEFVTHWAGFLPLDI